MSEETDNPRVLIYDLETAGVNALQADLSSVVCFGYKWLGDESAQVLTVDQFPRWFGVNGLNDKPLLAAALKIMEQADVLVAHYGDYFDRVYFQGRCVIQGLKPPPPTKQRDTWQIARRAFKFSSNRLGNLANLLGVSQKKYSKSVPDEWPGWWLKAMAGNRSAIRQMAKYCAQDVETLEQVYLRIRQYDNSHPRLVADRFVCGLCGGPVQYRGFAYAQLNRYRRYQCTRCFKWGRESVKA